MTPKETAELLGTLKIFWPNHPTPDMEKTIAAWTMVIGDIPYADMQTAVKNYMRSGSPFFPMPAQLIGMIADDRLDDLIPEACWSEVQRQVRDVGFGRPPIYRNGVFDDRPGPAFTHPLIAQAVENIGWKAICMAEDQQEMQKSFFFTLKALKDHAKTQIKRTPMDGESLDAIDGKITLVQLGAGR